MVSDNKDNKIKLIKNCLNKELSDNILSTLETHPSRYVQHATSQLWPLF